MESEIELIKKDLSFQLTFEDIDWEYFIETAQRAKEIQDKIDLKTNKKRK